MYVSAGVPLHEAFASNALVMPSRVSEPRSCWALALAAKPPMVNSIVSPAVVLINVTPATVCRLGCLVGLETKATRRRTSDDVAGRRELRLTRECRLSRG